MTASFKPNGNTLLSLLIVAACVLFAFAVNAQTYTMTVGPKDRILSQSYNTTTAKAKYPRYFGWMQHQGYTDAQAMAVNEFTAEALDLVWKDDGFIGATPYYQNGCQSRAIIYAPHGCYTLTYPAPIWQGQFIGAGTGNYCDGSGTTGGTRLSIDHANWMDKTRPRNAMETLPCGDNWIYEYVESYQVYGFRLEGNAGEYATDAYESNGIVIRGSGSGETSRIEYVFATAFNDYGLKIYGGTPNTVELASLFRCKRGSIAIVNGAGSTTYLSSISQDDSPYILRQTSEDGGTPGGTVIWNMGKSETGPAPARDDSKGTVVADLNGWFNVTINGLNYSSVNGIPPSLFRIGTVTNNSQLNVNGLLVWGKVGSLIQDDNRNVVLKNADVGELAPWWSSPLHTFVYNSSGTFWAPAGRVTESPNNANGRLDWLREDAQGNPIGRFDWVAGTPAFSFTGGSTPPPPVTCTWVTGQWVEDGGCVSNVQKFTRLVTSSVGGCTPTDAKPAEAKTEACGTTPPPPSGVIFRTDFNGPNCTLQGTGTPLTNKGWNSCGVQSGGKMTSTRWTSYTWSGEAATSVTFIGISGKPSQWSELTNEHYCNSDGTVVWRRTGEVVGTITGTASDLTLPVNALERLFGGPSAGNGAVVTVDALEVR